jgi:hypothetical protein
MLGWLFRLTTSLIIFGLLAYMVVAVPIGRRTLLEHASSIARTKPAEELTEDVRSATTGALERARTALK